MSNIEGKLKGLQERFENEMRIQRQGLHNQGGLGASKSGSTRRPRPPAMFSNRDLPVFPPRSPQASETEYRMQEVYKVSGKLNVNGVEYKTGIDELQQLGELGSGTCGHVVKMLHKSSGAVIAVKQMRRSGNSEETKRILMDLDVVVRSHDCPYIVRCLGCIVTDADVWICMELMASCFDKLLKRLGAPIPEAILGKVTVATVNALSYLKDTHGVIHRDVKPSNILLDERGNVKLCDFGISGRLVDSKAKTRSAGCAAYMAPERIDPPDPSRPDYDIRADVWSLGISLVELATGIFPYRDCQNDFEVLTRVIADDPPQLPETSDFTPEFKSFVSQCLTKNYRHRPKYAKLLEHPFVVKSTRNKVSVDAWYASLYIASESHTPTHVSQTPQNLHVPQINQHVPQKNQHVQNNHSPQNNQHSLHKSQHVLQKSQPVMQNSHHVLQSNQLVSPSSQHVLSNQHVSLNNHHVLQSGQHVSPNNHHALQSNQNVSANNYHALQSNQHVSPSNQHALSGQHVFVPSQHVPLSQPSPVTPQPTRHCFTSHWTPDQATPTPSRAWWATPPNAGGSSSQPASLEADLSNHSPYPRRRTLDACASPPPAPARRVSADSRWRASPASSGNTSPIVLQRFYHQSQQRKSRVDLHSTPRHRSLSREHSTGRSPEPPPRTRHLLTYEANGTTELEPPPLHDRLHPPSPLLLSNDRLSEGRSQSLTRAELRNGYRAEPKLHHDDQGWLHSLAGLVKRRLSGYVKWHHVAARAPHHAARARHRWGNSESWSVPASPLPPRAPPPRPAD